MSDEPSAWDAAVESFVRGYGDGPPNLSDPQDRAVFAKLLEDEVRHRFGAELVECFDRRGKQLLAQLAEDLP